MILKSVAVMFTDEMGPLVNKVLELTYTHVGVRFQGDHMWYEATWPRVKRSASLRHVKQTTKVIWVPEDSFTEMIEYADSMIGTRYSAIGYFVPKLYGFTRGIYCSQYAEYILRAGGVDIPEGSGYSPDKLLRELNDA